MRFVSLSSLSFLLLACRPETPPPDAADSTETGEDEHVGTRGPYRDIWREELVLPAAGFARLIVGGLLTSDNFANRGDIEILYVEGSTQIVVQLQRFTFASDAEHAEQAFARMSLWAYGLAEVERWEPRIGDVNAVDLIARIFHRDAEAGDAFDGDMADDQGALHRRQQAQMRAGCKTGSLAARKRQLRP